MFPQDKENHKAGDPLELTIKNVKYTFRWCPAGTFQMGSPQSEANRNDNEVQHTVMFSRGFWMLETEVTMSMYLSVMGNNPSKFKRVKLPMEQVSWNDCQEYIKKLNELKVAPAGFKFALPTESQWEYACRAGTTTAYHFGDTLKKGQATYGGKQIKNVGSYPANAWGLRDMHGNVGEWCADWYGDYPTGTVTDPTGAESGSSRVIRGGSWFEDTEFCRSAFRGYFDPSDWNNLFGFRLALVSGE